MHIQRYFIGLCIRLRGELMGDRSLSANERRAHGWPQSISQWEETSRVTAVYQPMSGDLTGDCSLSANERRPHGWPQSISQWEETSRVTAVYQPMRGDLTGDCSLSRNALCSCGMWQREARNVAQSWLVLRWATVSGFNSRCWTFILVRNQPAIQGQLSLPSLRGR